MTNNRAIGIADNGAIGDLLVKGEILEDGTPTGTTADQQTAWKAPAAFVGEHVTDLHSIWISPDQFVTSAGSPAIPGSLLIPALPLDPAAVEIVLASFRTPASWVTATVSLWYYTGSGTGNVIINPRVYAAGDGESAAPSPETGITTELTIPGGTAAVVEIVSCGTFTCQPAKACAFWVQRNATAGTDTNGADFWIVGASIAKAS